MVKTQEDFFNKIFTSHFIARVRKGLFKVCVWEGVGDRTETAIFWPPLLWPSTLCLSRSLDAQPEAQRPLCWVMAFFTASYQHLLWTSTHQGPKAPSALCGFPYHISSITPSDLQLNCPELNSPGSSNSTELYNRSTPTRSLKSNV